jgi:hypothetical protein
MSFIVAIPSLGRAQVLKSKTLTFLKTNDIPEHLIYVFIIEEEEELYRNELQGFNGHIIIGEKGLPAQRNFIQKYFDEDMNIFCLDDDVQSWNNKSNLFKHYSLLEFVDFAFQHCRKTKSFIWSIYPVNNDFYAKGNAEITHSLRYCIGAFYGIINRQDFLLDFIENEKEDVRRSLLYYIKDGIVLRFNRIMFETKYYGTVGGMGNFDSRLEASKSQVLSLIDEYDAYGYKVIKKTGMWDFRFKNKSCQVDNCYCRRQATVYNDMVIHLPDESDIEVNFPIITEMNDSSVQQFDEIDSSEFDYLLQLLKNITFKSVVKNHRKGFPSHRCAVFGYTNYRVVKKKGIYSGLSSDSNKYPEIYSELLRLGQNIVCPNREFNAIHINHNLTCPPHKDDKNVGKSILVSIGNYTGSDLVVNGIPYKTYCRPIRFNGCNLLHYNTPDLNGDKYSIVYYVANLRKNKTENEIYENYDAVNEDDFEEFHIDDDDNSCYFDEN